MVGAVAIGTIPSRVPGPNANEVAYVSRRGSPNRAHDDTQRGWTRAGPLSSSLNEVRKERVRFGIQKAFVPQHRPVRTTTCLPRAAWKGHRAVNMASWARAVLVNWTILLLWLLLLVVDGCLRLARWMTGFVRWTHRADGARKTVVIVGGGLGGLKVQRVLARHKHTLDVIVIEPKEYFEYIPGVLRCLVKPSHFGEISCAIPTSPNRAVRGEAVSLDVANSLITVQGPRDAGTTVLQYDFAVLACGSSYVAPIKPQTVKAAPCEASDQTSGRTIAGRRAELQAAHAELQAAQRVVIVGAGPVGVELAGEISAAYGSSKSVTLVDMAPSILPGMNDATVSYAMDWLQRNGVDMLLGVALENIEERAIVLPGGKRLPADVVYRCVGGKPCTGWVASALPPAAIGSRGAVKVNDHLQVAGVAAANLFCVGDMMLHPASNELKLGHTAEMNADLVAHNIVKLATSGVPGRLLRYPEGAVGASTTPRIYNLSLGAFDGIMSFNGLTLRGYPAAVTKWMLEWTKVAAAEHRPVGELFWWAADLGSCLLSRAMLAVTAGSNT